jgi:hypothetical protein
MTTYLAYVRDSKITIGGGGKLTHVYPDGEGKKTTMVAVDTGRSIEFCLDRLYPDTVFVAETYEGAYAEIRKRGWEIAAPLSLAKPQPEVTELAEPGVVLDGQDSAEYQSEPEAEVIEVKAEVTKVKDVEAAPVEKPEKICPQCGGPPKSRGFAHAPDCPILDKYKPNIVGEKPNECPKCCGPRSANNRGFIHKDGCVNSTAVKYPHTLKRKHV